VALIARNRLLCTSMSRCLLIFPFFLIISAILPAAADSGSTVGPKSFNEQEALAFSQGVIGKTIRDYSLTQPDGTAVRVSDYNGKPIVFSLIYTSCYHICPTTTQHLAKVVRKAKAVLGQDSFTVITLGFDTQNDTPEAMRIFAAQQSVDVPGWLFVSANKDTITDLAKDLGFLFYPSPNGFDHLIQATIVDAKGTVYHQVYDMNFATPSLVEPLKALVFGTSESTPLITHIGNKIRLFCTVYDPANDRYRIDYSIFVGMAIGLSTLVAVLYLVVRQWLRQKSGFS